MGGNLESQGLLSAPGPSPAAEPMIQDTTAPLQTCFFCSIGELIIGPKATHWSRLLQDHLCSSSKRALFATCTAARDNVLVAAERATFKLTCTAEPAASQAGLQAVRQALQTRNRRRTKLQIRASTTDHLSHALGFLGDSTAWLGELHLQCGQAISTGAILSIGHGCPNLWALTINAPLPELPSPQLFPKLKQLSISSSLQPARTSRNDPLKRAARSIAPYSKQLTHLSVNRVYMAPTVVRHLLSPGRIGSHLHTLHLNTELNDTLLGLILQCAPALEQFSVDTIWLQSDARARAPAQWKRLQCSMLRMSSLACLPEVAHGMELSLSAGHGQSVVVCDTTSTTHDAVAARLADVQLSFSTGDRRDPEPAIVFAPSKNGMVGAVAVGNQPAALRLALSLLRFSPTGHSTAARSAQHSMLPTATPSAPCSVAGPPEHSAVPAVPYIQLHGWTMSAEVMQELAAGLPSWDRSLELSASWPLQPELYSPLLSLLPTSTDLVSIDTKGLSRQRIESICLGAPRSRAPEAPLHVELWYCNRAVVQAIRNKLMLAAIRNVVVGARFQDDDDQGE